MFRSKLGISSDTELETLQLKEKVGSKLLVNSGSSREIEKLARNCAEKSTFVEETLVNRNYQVWLEQEDIANIAKIEYGWYGVKSNVLFEVIGSVEQLRAQLERYICILEEKKKQSLTFIINLNNCHWVTLVISQQLSAYYIDSFGEELSQTLKDILGDIYIEDFKIEQQHDGYNCGIFALENARIINEALRNPQMPQHRELLNLQLTDINLKSRRKEFALALHWREVVESKFKVLLIFLKKLNYRYRKLDSIVNFNYENANVFLLFLETLAMQDQKLQNSGCEDKELELRKMYEQKIWDSKIIAINDIALIQHIRTTTIIHRDNVSKLCPHHFWKIINYEKESGVRRCFQDLEKCVQQIFMKLTGEMDNLNNLEQPKELFKRINENEKFGQIITHDKQIMNMLKFFRNAIGKQCYEADRLNLENANEMMFDLFVNIVPFIDEKKKSLVEPLQKVKEIRGNLFHEFYECGDNYKIMGIRLKTFVQNYKQHFFKYYFSQKVQSVLRNVGPRDEAEHIEGCIRNLLQDLQNEFIEEYIIVREEENNVQIQSSSDLEMCVHEYLKLFCVIDNEETISMREKKYKEGNVPARYRQLSSYVRRNIYDDFKHLRNLHEMVKNGIPDSVDKYNEEKKLIIAKYKAPYGILKDDFNSMIKSYVENDDITGKKEDTENEIDIINALFCLQKIKKHHSNLSNKDIITKFYNRQNVQGNKGSPEEKIHMLPKGKLKDIKICTGKNGKTKTVLIDTDKFVHNIFEMINSTYNENNLVFNNLKEAFSDEIFLDLLEKEHEHVDEILIEKLLKIDYMTPYVARLLTKDKLINKKIVSVETFLDTIKKLLSADSNIIIFKRFLKELSANNKINGKKLKSILKPDSKIFNENNIKPVFYEHICNIIKNQSSIQNMNFIFEEPEYSEGILSVLSQKMKQGKSSDTDIELTKNILKLLNNIAKELSFKGNRKAYDLALQLLDGKKGTQEARKSLIKKELAHENDLFILQAKHCIARIKYKQGRMETNVKEAQKWYCESNKILLAIKDKLEKKIKEMSFPTTDLNFMFLITLRDQAYTQHLLHDCSSAYETYKTLYECVIKCILHACDYDLSHKLSKENYYRITQSETYKDILKFSPKYLNILKIRSDMAYECKCLAEEKRKSLPKKESQDLKTKFDEVVHLYNNALNIYMEVYEIKQNYSVFGQDILKTQRDVAYVLSRLGHLKLFNDYEITNVDNALHFLEAAMKMYQEVKRSQAQEKWEEHPAVCRIEECLRQIERKIAYIHNKLGDSKLYSNPDKALQHYKKALKFYDKVHGFQEINFNEEHDHTLCTLNDIALTNNKLARNFKLQSNSEEAFKHYERACKIYEKILEIQIRIFGDENNRTQKTRKDLELTKGWMSKL